MKEFTLAEVAAHNTRDDLYLVIHDEVYEVSKFVTEVGFIIKIIPKYRFGNLTSISFLVLASRWD